MKEMSPKTKKILNIVVDVVVAAVIILALILAISTITSRKKGYKDCTVVFGTAYLSVESPSMTGTFNKGDLIAVKTISSSEAKKLKEDTIITFFTNTIVNGRKVLNTHRIVGINYSDEAKTKVISYVTKGDANSTNDSTPVSVNDVFGVYKGKASGIGKMFTWMQTSTGFFVCVVLPTLLVVVYCAVHLVLVILKERKKQKEDAILADIAKAEEQAAERERIRAELLAEMEVKPNLTKPAAPAEPAPEEPFEELSEEPKEEAPVEEVAKAPAEQPADEAPAAEPAEKAEDKAEEVPAEKPAKKPAAKKTTTKKTTNTEKE